MEYDGAIWGKTKINPSIKIPLSVCINMKYWVFLGREYNPVFVVASKEGPLTTGM